MTLVYEHSRTNINTHMRTVMGIAPYVCVCVCVCECFTCVYACCVCMHVCMFVFPGSSFYLAMFAANYVLRFEKSYCRMFRFDVCDPRLLHLRVVDGCPLLF